MGIYGDLEKLNERKYIAKPQGARSTAPMATPTSSEEPVVQPSSNRATETPRNHATTQPRNNGGMVSRHHDVLIPIVRAAVKLFGKEAATHRFTLEEKQTIADIVYRYKQEGIRTSENEITRIGVNFILSDFKENKAGSILARVLKALNS